MIVWRLGKARFARTAFTGEGSRRFGGRWNPAGTPVVYTSSTRALAAMEMLVHVGDPSALPPLVLVSAEVPDALVEALPEDAWPAGWDRLPPGPWTQRLGADWYASRRSLALRVPSVVIRGEANVLLNPHHPAFERVVIGRPEPFSFDARL